MSVTCLQILVFLMTNCLHWKPFQSSLGQVTTPKYERPACVWKGLSQQIKFIKKTLPPMKNYGWVLSDSMTSLLTHTVAHFTRPSFRPKTNNQPIKKFLSLAVSWVKVVKNGKILTFKVNFLCQKWSESFYFVTDIFDNFNL